MIPLQFLLVGEPLEQGLGESRVRAATKWAGEEEAGALDLLEPAVAVPRTLTFQLSVSYRASGAREAGRQQRGGPGPGRARDGLIHGRY